jgi:hypothetical protein
MFQRDLEGVSFRLSLDAARSFFAQLRFEIEECG